MFSSIRLRITVLFVSLIVIIELAAGLFGLYRTTSYYRESFDKKIHLVFTDDVKKELTDAANAVSDAALPEGTDGLVMSDSGPDNVNSIADIVTRYSDALELNGTPYFCVLDNTGAVVFSSSAAGATEDSPVIKSALAGTENIDTATASKSAEYALPLKSGDVVKYVVYIKDPLTVQNTIAARLLRDLILSTIIAGIIAWLSAQLLARSVTVPLKALSNSARRMADGDNTAITRISKAEEIDELADSLVYLSESKREHADKATAEMTKIEKILQNMNDGILAFDMKGKLTHINPEAKKLLKRNFVDDITFNKFFKEINADITLESLQYVPVEDSVERELHLNDLLLQFNFAVFSPDSNEGGVIVIIHDVTKHERLESSRRDFVANVSHELRTPLTVIKSYADILADTPDAEPEVRTRFLDTISSETDRMTKIISDLLTLSKLDENANYTRPNEEIDIRVMLEGLVERLSLSAKKKEQTLTYTPMNDVPIIRGDRDGLERVFTNIITNALKYTSAGGEINVFSSKVYNDILIKISDNGIGIPKDQLPHIFDRFYRVDKARSRDKGGTGLGLAIAKETVENGFHGKIIITSELNKGTDVTVSLPAPKK